MKRILGSSCVAALLACGTSPQGDATIASGNSFDAVDTVASDIKAELGVFEEVEVLRTNRRGVVEAMRGRLGRDDAKVLRAFRLAPSDLDRSRVDTDELGMTHTRLKQKKNGLPVVGGDLIIHRDAAGNITSINGTAQGDVDAPNMPTVNADQAKAKALAAAIDIVGASVPAIDLKYIVDSIGDYNLAWEVAVSGTRNEIEAYDLVYVNAVSGEVVDTHPQIHSARSQEIYSANNGTTLPGTLKRSTGSASSTDAVVNTNYSHFGSTYNCFKNIFNRDSYNNIGATIKSSVHYGTKYNNAFWSSLNDQFAFGDGDGIRFNGFQSIDIIAHEFTHAVTQHTAGLVYSKQSGGLNESMSDVFGAVCEAYVLGYVNANAWKIGELIYTPGTGADALRYMKDPALDGKSIDRLSQYTDSTDVHYSSGISNLAFYLLVEGGSHPRYTTPSVAALGITKARAIWYRALTLYMTSMTDFFGARLATLQAARDLYPTTTTEVTSVGKAWDAVGVTGTTSTLKTWSFETDSDGAGWTSFINCAVGGQTYMIDYATVSPPAPGGGSRAVRFAAGSFADGCLAPGVYAESPALAATPGKTYVVDAYTRNNSNVGTTALTFYDAAGKQIGGSVSAIWNTDTGVFNADKPVYKVAPSGTATLKVRIGLNAANAVTYIDLVKITSK